MKKNDYLEELKEMAGEFDDEPKSNGADSEENAAAEEKPESLDMEDSIECEVTVRTKDMRSFLFSHNYSSFSGWFGVIISLIALVMVIAGREKYGTAEICILIFLALLFTVIRPLQIVNQAKRQVARQEMFKKPIRYNVCKEGIVISQGDEFANVLWADIRKLKETKKTILIYTSPVMAFILPKDQINNGSAIVERIKANIHGK